MDLLPVADQGLRCPNYFRLMRMQSQVLKKSIQVIFHIFFLNVLLLGHALSTGVTFKKSARCCGLCLLFPCAAQAVWRSN